MVQNLKLFEENKETLYKCITNIKRTIQNIENHSKKLNDLESYKISRKIEDSFLNVSETDLLLTRILNTAKARDEALKKRTKKKSKSKSGKKKSRSSRKSGTGGKTAAKKTSGKKKTAKKKKTESGKKTAKKKTSKKKKSGKKSSKKKTKKKSR